jgi:hypothetical protein
VGTLSKLGPHKAPLLRRSALRVRLRLALGINKENT